MTNTVTTATPVRTGPTAAGSLAAGWAEKCGNAQSTVLEAMRAPALFKPEHVEQLQATARRAESQYRYWALQELIA